MKILALDTSTRVAGAAVMDETGIVAESWLNREKNHSRIFLPMLESMLKNADLAWEEITGFVVTVGPGSFTGLRIGLATVKGLAQVEQKPLAGIITLDALAANMAGAGTLVCPVLDARKNEVYTALYRGEAGQVTRLSSYRAIAPGKLLDELAAGSEEVVFLGDAVPVYRPLIERLMGRKALFAPVTRNLLRAAEVAFLGWEKFRAGKTVGIDEIKPFYLRPSEAEVKWRQNQGECCG